MMHCYFQHCIGKMLYLIIALLIICIMIHREQLLEALLEASKHLLVPEMVHNKALSVAKEVAGSLLQVGSHCLASLCIGPEAFGNTEIWYQMN